MTQSQIARLQGQVNLALEAPGPALSLSAAPVLPAAPRAARPVNLAPLTGGPPRVISSRVAKTTITFLIDDSGSMYGAWGDPTGIRYAAAESVLMLMRRHGGGRAGVIHWGSTVPPELALAPVDVRRDRKALRRALTIPQSLLGNDLPAALRAAASSVGSARQEEVSLVFVVTDGIEAVTTDTHAAVAALPEGAVHMVLVDRSNGCTPPMEAAWQAVAFGSFTRLQTFDTKAMAIQIAATFAHALELELEQA
jgi:hypothetical protein